MSSVLDNCAYLCFEKKQTSLMHGVNASAIMRGKINSNVLAVKNILIEY
jgi:hypothetical protein